MDTARITHFLRIIARILITAIAIFFFMFALLSGAEEYGGGISGIIQNSPNALPWALLLVLAGATYKWEKGSGVIVVLFGLFMLFAFNAWNEPFVLFAISLPLIILGGILVGTSVYTRKNRQES
ncbi:MAG: hypothetical protein H8D63_00585 [Parcubacteria group bacterium]|nr:hypothetical protein [Parcubacteria group bacterium]